MQALCFILQGVYVLAHNWARAMQGFQLAINIGAVMYSMFV